MDISIVRLAQARDVELWRLWRSWRRDSRQRRNIFLFSHSILLLSQDFAPSRDVLGRCVGCKISGGLLSLKIPLCD